jgi:hypothetical protein
MCVLIGSFSLLGLGGAFSAAPATTSPVLGHSWAPFQTGYGKARPITVYNGGDPTGLVRKIRWSDWGGGMSVGSGISTYVWPGTVTASNRPTAGARIVAFHLATCHGTPSYNAVEWYFPKYDETFDPNRYINACTGAYVGFSPHTNHCPDVLLAKNRRKATRVQVIQMTCASARRLIAAAPAARYVKSGGRFMQSGFRCGSSGPMGFSSTLFDCQFGQREFLYELSA